MKAYNLYSKGHVYLIHDHASTNTMTSFITVMFGILNKTKFIKRKLLHKATKLIYREFSVSLFTFYYSQCVWLCLCVCTWIPKDDLPALAFFFLCADLLDLTQLEWQVFYSMSHIDDPMFCLFVFWFVS